MRRIAPLALGLLLLSPLLAHADALDGAAMALELLAAIWGLALLLMLVSLLAYRRPASHTLRRLNYAGIGLSGLLGLAGLVFAGSSNGSALGLGEANPFLRLSLPFAAWLGGANWATFATQPQARRWGVAVAAAGALPTMSTLLNLLTRWLLSAIMSFGLGGGYSIVLLFKVLTMVGAWWVVLAQVQRRQPLGWHEPRPVLLVPALATGLGIAYTYLPYVGGLDLEWLALAVVGLLGEGLLGCAVGALAIWLNQRRYRAEVLP